MARTPEEQAAWEQQAMGCSKQNVLDMKPSFISDLMEAMSWLSDAQEEAARGNAEVTRQLINRAKVFIILEMDKQQPKEAS